MFVGCFAQGVGSGFQWHFLHPALRSVLGLNRRISNPSWGVRSSCSRHQRQQQGRFGEGAGAGSRSGGHDSNDGINNASTERGRHPAARHTGTSCVGVLVVGGRDVLAFCVTM